MIVTPAPLHRVPHSTGSRGSCWRLGIYGIPRVQAGPAVLGRALAVEGSLRGVGVQAHVVLERDVLRAHVHQVDDDVVDLLVVERALVPDAPRRHRAAALLDHLVDVLGGLDRRVRRVAERARADVREVRRVARTAAPAWITPPRSSGPWHRTHPTPSWFSSLNSCTAGLAALERLRLEQLVSCSRFCEGSRSQVNGIQITKNATSTTPQPCSFCSSGVSSAASDGTGPHRRAGCRAPAPCVPAAQEQREAGGDRQERAEDEQDDARDARSPPSCRLPVPSPVRSRFLSSPGPRRTGPAGVR